MEKIIKILTLIPLIILLISLLIMPSVTQTDLLTPPVSLQWTSSDLGDIVSKISWSPNGDKIAVGVGLGSSTGKVVVFSSSGNILWSYDGLVHGVKDIAWDPSGEYLAVGTALDTWSHPDEKYNRLYLFSADGTLLWFKEIYGEATSIAWSPDGKYIAIGTRVCCDYGKVEVYDVAGNLMWNSDNLGAPVLSVAWSPDGNYIAAGRDYGRLYVFKKDGVLAWSVEVDYSYSVWVVTWDRQSRLLAATGPCCGTTGYVYMFDSSGNELWRTKNVGWSAFCLKVDPLNNLVATGTSSGKIYLIDLSTGNVIVESSYLETSQILSLDWSPNGKYIAVGTKDSHKVFIFSNTGEILWESEDFGNYVRDVAWSPDGSELAVAVGYDVHVFSISTGSGMVSISGSSSLSLRVCFFDGSVSDCYDLNASGLKIHADPGNYEIRYYLTNVPGGFNFVGDFGYFNVHPVVEQLKVSAGGSYSLTPPSINEFFGGLVLHAPEGLGLVANVSWSSGSRVFSVPPGGEISVPAVPGYYTIKFRVYGVSLDSASFIGSPSWLVGSSVVEKVSVSGAGDYVSVKPSVSDFLGSLRVSSSCDAVTVVSWDSGSVSGDVSAGSFVEWPAAPGNYSVVVTPMNASACLGALVVGDIGINANNVEGAVLKEDVTVYAGSVAQVTYFPKDLVAVMKVVNPFPFPVTMNVSWGSGSKVVEVSPGGSVSLYAAPGKYLLRAYPAASLLGSEVPVLEEVVEVSGAGSSVEVSLAGRPLNSVGFIRLSNPSPVPALVSISWSSGSTQVSLGMGEEQVVPAVPGEYRIKAVPGVDVVGYGAGFVRDVSVPAGGSADVAVDLPVGFLRVSGSGDAVLLFSNGSVAWSGGGGSGVWVGAGDYVCRLRFTGPAPQDLVGDLGSYWVEVPLSVEGGAERSLDVGSSVLGSLASLRVVGPAGASVTVSWGGGSRSFVVLGSGVLELRAVPGTEYRVVVPAPDAFHSGFSSVVSVPSAGSVASVSVSFPFSPLFYAVVLGAVGAFGASFYAFAVRSRVSVRLLTGEVVEGLTEFVEVEFRNSGLMGTSFRASVEVGGVEAFSGVIELPERSRKVVRVRIKPGAPGGGVGGGVRVVGVEPMEAGEGGGGGA